MTTSLQILVDRYRLPISSELVQLLEKALIGHTPDRGQDRAIAVTFCFRDPNYSAESGGYHPVEIRLQLEHSEKRCVGRFDYITDFSFVGIGQDAELTKEIDFDFSAGVCSVIYSGYFSLNKAAEFYQLWQQNFTDYHAMGVFDVTVTLEH
ncbi:MAG: DUF2787 family protein [Amphritea sp.]